MRMVADCRELPSESHCSLTITGEEQEVVRAAAEHAVSVHGHADGDSLRDAIRSTLRPEPGGRVDGYGTTMVASLARGTREEIMAVLEEWENRQRVPGFLGAQLQVSDDGRTLVNTAVFTDKEAYDRLANDPAQDEFYRTRMAPFLEGEPTWTDGHWSVYFRQPTIVLPQQSGAPTGAPASV